MSLHNDSEFKSALATLDLAQQRRVAALCVERVLDLTDDARVRAAVDAARRGDLAEAEAEALHQAAKAARVESFTQCGREADWAAQAGHFVARAAVSCVKAPAQGENLAWDAAMHARMARTCQGVAQGSGTETREAEAQYAILDEFLKA
ncbi:MAG TPA: hypothetical protein PKH69_07535 [Thiobacillaceae bacterium]|nr:hypothetical protein [Thiobacillaceae bacterium]HNU64049.1 hypothetical protein [Thiobacillaceae bacterium]